MIPFEVIAIIIIILVVGGALFYIIKAKKEGQKCIGCPYAKDCKKRNHKCECKED